jgi:epoxyqueuosine reductase
MLSWESKLQEWCEKTGASQAGIARLEKPLSWDSYKKWLEKGFAGEMNYLHKHAEMKEDPARWRPHLRSAFVFAFPYLEHPRPVGLSNRPQKLKHFSRARIALYAQGEDYHSWLKEKLQVVIEELKGLAPDQVFEAHTDSSPVLERDLGYRAGLGWFGKNTCLIHPKKGSLFLVGEILTSLEVSSSPAPLPDFCGTCQKCLEICPTKALPEPRSLDATRCISYWTIESQKIPPPEIREKIGDWLFGCDLCQTVCPWNQKIFKGRLEIRPVLELREEEAQELVEELKWILSSSNNQILKAVRGTPLTRAGGKGLKRNALIVIGNRKIRELEVEVQRLTADPFLGKLAEWTLEQLQRAAPP